MIGVGRFEVAPCHASVTSPGGQTVGQVERTALPGVPDAIYRVSGPGIGRSFEDFADAANTLIDATEIPAAFVVDQWAVLDGAHADREVGWVVRSRYRASRAFLAFASMPGRLDRLGNHADRDGAVGAIVSALTGTASARLTLRWSVGVSGTPEMIWRVPGRTDRPCLPGPVVRPARHQISEDTLTLGLDGLWHLLGADEASAEVA